VILVDTSVWIDFFRGKDCPSTATLHRLLQDDDVCICGPILMELLQGIQNSREYQEIQDFANSLIYFPFSEQYFWDAAHLYRTCRRKGVTIRKTIDCLIAACAIEHKVRLLHDDSDFALLSQFTPLSIYQMES
jgi:predicted nucleic acid-binding protein